jgi:hypothetical protein
VNVAVLVASNGFKNSSLITTSEPGMLFSMLMRPSPTSLLPIQAYLAPTPAGAPSYVRFMAGSSFSQGDQAPQA